MINNCTTNILDINISDHLFIYLNRKHCAKPKAKLDFTGRSYKNYNEMILCDRLMNIDWNDLYQCGNVNQAWDIMLTNITSIIDEMCPLKRYKVAQAKLKEPWVTNEILELIKDKDRLLRRAKCNNNQQDWILAKNARNNVNQQIRGAKANFVQENLNIHQNN